MDISIAVHDTKEALIKMLNTSHLPMCVIKEILQNIYMEVSNKAEFEYNQALAKAETKNTQEVEDA